MKSRVLLESHLKTLKLPAMHRAYGKVARQCGEGNRDYESYLEELAGLEVAQRESRAMDRRIRQAGFPMVKELADFEFAAVPHLNRKRVLDLSKGEYIDRRENIVLVGPPGVGKTHLAIALGREACRQGRRVKFFTAAGLVNAYVEARQEKEVERLEAHIERRGLIVIDELGYLPLSQAGAEYLFGFFSRCYERVSVIVTTNLPFSEWPQVMHGDERLAGALLDRLTHRVSVLEVRGDSYRLRLSAVPAQAGPALPADGSGLHPVQGARNPQLPDEVVEGGDTEPSSNAGG